MKIKNIFAALIAVLTFGLVSCSEDFAPTYLDDIHVSSYITFPQEGGSQSFILTTSGDWTISDVPKGFDVVPMSGTAGENTITVTTVATELSNEGSFFINCNDNRQIVNVQQQGVSYPDFKEGKYWIMFNTGDKWVVAKPCATEIGSASSYAYIYCDDAFVAEDGTLSSTAANVYTFKKTDGGFHLSDSEGGYLYQSGNYNNFYRATTGGEYIWKVSQIGPQAYNIESNTSHIMSYSVSYTSIGAYSGFSDGSLRPYLVPAKDPAPEVIKMEKTDISVSKDGGKFVVPAMINADNVSVEYDAAWLHYYGTGADGFNFGCDALDGCPRSASVVVKANLGEFAVEVKLNISQEGTMGTLENPLTVLQAIEAAKNGVTSKVYIKGVVCELVKGGFDPAYGNGSFWISDDGSYKGDKSVEFEAYQVNYLGGNKWNSETDPQIAVGDNVVIYGPLTVYQGTAETQGKGAAYIYSHNGKK